MNNQVTAPSPLTDPTVLPLRLVTEIAPACVLVVAPHPDDETLGCGGAIALLRPACDVRVLVISDGTLSHPRSQKYPAPALRKLRESETTKALAVLGVDATAITFLRLQDGSIPTPESAEFISAVVSCQACLVELAPQAIFLPWRCDPHPDHRATWKLIYTALLNLPLSPRLIEYPIWDWDPEQRGKGEWGQEQSPTAYSALPNPGQLTSWRLDISAVVDLKQQAIAAYCSQTTNLIDDDPEGFRLTPEMLANFTRPWEVYLEEII